jgi:hypothetical protein
MRLTRTTGRIKLVSTMIWKELPPGDGSPAAIPVKVNSLLSSTSAQVVSLLR